VSYGSAEAGLVTLDTVALSTFAFYAPSRNYEDDYSFFGAEGFRRRLQGLADAELITLGRMVSPDA
jgi:hypothetical protein